MQGTERYSVVIVGAGFTGSLVAAHLLRGAQRPETRVAIVERTGRFTAGVAYGTRDACHTLNVPVGRMSAFEDDPDDFLRFATGVEPGVTGGSFVRRALYGDYLAHLLARAEEGSVASLARIPAEATGVVAEPGRPPQVELAGRAALAADSVVLAIGNFPPATPAVAGLDPADPRYARDPWAEGALRVDPAEPVLLVGTGLTMLDIALALRERGQRGVIHAVSRHGLLPQPHRVAAAAPPHHPRPAGLDGWPRTAAGLLRSLRAEVRRAAAEGVDWREVHTSLRADTPALWRSLDTAERERFLRHLRPYWETHRHRSSPQTAAAIEELVTTGALRVTAGRLVSVDGSGGRLAVRVLPRGASEAIVLEVGRLINCTGPDADLTRVPEPIVRQLLASGLATPDPLGLGLQTTERGELVGADGTARERAFLVGPLRKGLLWENTAVPELRVEAARLAAHLAALDHL